MLACAHQTLSTALQVVMWFAGLRGGVTFGIASVFTPQVIT